MNSRLAASISPLLSTGISRRFRISIARLNDQISSSFYSQRFEGSSRAVHSSSTEDDSFSELGPETSDCTVKQIKLVTEKPEYYAKTDSSGRELVDRSVLDTRPKIKYSVTPERASPTRKNSGSANYASTLENNNKISSRESTSSVLIKNIPPTIGLYELVEAISICGTVAGASFITASHDLKCCNIKFESVDSSRRAILAGKIAVDNRVFPVHSIDAVDLVGVRIKGISQETSDYAIHSICKSVGELTGLARTSTDGVDVFFNVRNDSVRMDILKRLNSTVTDNSPWSASILTIDPSDEEVRYKLGSKIFYQFSEVKRQQVMKKVYLEDLETLLASILHIQEKTPVADLRT